MAMPTYASHTFEKQNYFKDSVFGTNKLCTIAYFILFKCFI